MYLAQKEAWEQWAEGDAGKAAQCMWSHRWGNQHSENTLPFSTNLEHDQMQFWKTYQDIMVKKGNRAHACVMHVCVWHAACLPNDFDKQACVLALNNCADEFELTL